MEVRQLLIGRSLLLPGPFCGKVEAGGGNLILIYLISNLPPFPFTIWAAQMLGRP